MIVFDLKCGAQGHVFEAWFASSDAFEEQRAKGLLGCPICGDTDIQKAVMAAAVPKKGNSRPEGLIAATANAGDDKAKALLSALVAAQEKLLEGSQWVGRKFDSQARAMDAGDIEKATIHGEVTGEEAKALLEDGIGVTPLPFPIVPPEKRN
jgi:hypothetical protein